MTSLVSKPKTPALPAPKVIPDADDAQKKLTERQKMAAAVAQQGRASTQLTEQQNKKLGT